MAVKAVPAVKYGVGVGGVIAVFALVRPFFQSPGAVLVAALMMFILMWVLLMFAAATKQAPVIFQLPILVFTWAILVFFLSCSGLTACSVFFQWPRPFTQLVRQFSGGSSQVTVTESPLPPDQQAKLEVEPSTHFYTVEQTVQVTVTMLNNSNHRITATKQVAITVQATSPSGASEESIGVIQAGQSSITAQFRAREPGTLKLMAFRTDLPSVRGSDAVNVSPRDSAQEHSNDPSGTQLYPRARTDLKVPLPLKQTTNKRSFGTEFLQVGLRSREITRNKWVYATQTSAPAPNNIKLSLLISPADALEVGTEAKLIIFLLDPKSRLVGAPSDIMVAFTANRAKVFPNPVVIKKGSFSAEARLTSTGPGVIDLVAHTSLNVEIERANLRINSISPVVALSLTTPQEVPLFGHGTLTINCLGANGQPVTAIEPIPVTLSVTGPIVRIEPSAMVIEPGATTASATIVPTAPGGLVTVEASSRGYPLSKATLRVTGTWQLIFLWLLTSGLGILTASSITRWSIAASLGGLTGSGIAALVFLFELLRHSSSAVLHSTISIFVVSTLTSYASCRLVSLFSPDKTTQRAQHDTRPSS